MLNRWIALTCVAFFIASSGDVNADVGESWVVGVLTHQHAEQCNGSWDSEWVDPHHEVGFVRLIPGKGIDLKAWEGKLVMVRGLPASPPVVEVKHTGDCPGRQARSDWIFAKNGVRLRRSWPRSRPAAFKAVEVKAFDGLTVRREGETLHLRFTNPFPNVTLDSVELQVHYEGCYGKPNTVTRHAKLGKIASGAHVDVELPTLFIDEDGPSGRTVHRAWSVQATTLSEGYHFAVDAPMGLFESGAVDCPERGQKKNATPPQKSKND